MTGNSEGEVQGEVDRSDCNVLVFCDFEKKSHVLTVNGRWTLSDIYSNLTVKWSEIKESSMILRYASPDGDFPIELQCDGDVEHMCRAHSVMKKTTCKMEAIARQQLNKKLRTDDEAQIGGDEAEDNEDQTLYWAQAITGEGQVFRNAEHFRKVVKNHSISIRRGMKYIKNDSKKVIVTCTKSECGWRIYASHHKSNQSFAIRKCSLEHNCGSNNLQDRQHPKADGNFVATFIKSKLRRDPNYCPNTAIDDMKAAFGVEVSYKRAWSGRDIALKEIHGGDGDSFVKLRGFCNAVKSTNPGSVADLEVYDETHKFRRVFICFGACVQGFKVGCRPMLFLDGTHIKSKWKGCLLSAVAKDANGGFLTLAYAVVDAENDCNWQWFCLKLRSATEGEGTTWGNYTFFSDRHSGLLKAIPIVFPGSHHAVCVRHLVDNFKVQVLRKYPFKNKEYWAGILNKAAYAPTKDEFQAHLNSILTAMPKAIDFLMNSDPSRWANSAFSGKRWGVINNNLAESWNGWVVNARGMSPLPMLDEIRKKTMRMMNEKREEGAKMVGPLCPEPEKFLKKNYMVSGKLNVQRASQSIFEVEDLANTCSVDVEKRTCMCGLWQLLCIPCIHACACIEKLHGDVYAFCDDSYKVEAYNATYAGFIYLIPNIAQVSEEVEVDIDDFVRAPDVRAQPGRRRMSRIPSQLETSKVRCGLCKRRGHNRRSCKESRTVE